MWLLHPDPSAHLLPHLIPPCCHRAPALGSLHHTSNSHCLSTLHMVMYVSMLFSQIIHPFLLPLDQKVYSLHLCLLCCPSCRIIHTIFLDPIYIHIYIYIYIYTYIYTLIYIICLSLSNLLYSI